MEAEDVPEAYMVTCPGTFLCLSGKLLILFGLENRIIPSCEPQNKYYNFLDNFESKIWIVQIFVVYLWYNNKQFNKMDGDFRIYKQKDWFWRKYDGRRKEFKNIDRSAFNAAKERHISRMPNGYVRNEYKTRREYIAYFATIPYEYQGDGMDDFNLYQRPASNGIGYVAICPGESGNNFYTDDPILVSYLTKKFNKHNG